MRSREPGPGPISPANEWSTIKTLLPYLWPSGEMGLRVRVVIAMALLIAAKATNVSVPIFYKQAVDTLTADGKIDALITVPIALILAYGLCRVAAMAFGEFRDAVFTRVAQRAIRQAGLKTFRHLHHLSLRFHLERKTGGVARAVHARRARRGGVAERQAARRDVQGWPRRAGQGCSGHARYRHGSRRRDARASAAPRWTPTA